MKKNFLLVLTIFLFTAVSYAQSEDAGITRIIWSKEGKCSGINLPDVRNESLQCVIQVADNMIFRTISYNNVVVSFSRYHFDEDLLRSTLQITNNSGNPVFIDVDKSYIAKYASEDSFLKNEKSKDFKFALNPQKIADKMWLSAVNPGGGGGFEGVRPGLRTQTRVSNEQDTRGMILVEPNTKKEKAPVTTIEKNRGKSSQWKRIVETALTSKNLPDKEKTEGHVYFKGYKNAEYKAVFVRIDNLEFVFPFK